MNALRTILPALLALTLSTAQAAGDTGLVQQATDAYAKGDYSRALVLYDSLNKSMTSASLLFNIGNCHMKLADVAHAILYYERAIRLQPGAEDIQANLDYARSQVVDRVNQLPGFSLGSVWDRLRGGKDVDQWARRSLWACLVLCGFATGFVVAKGQVMRRAMLAGSALAFIGTVISVALASYRVSEAVDRSSAIVMVPKVDVRGEPRSASNTLFVLHEGTKVNVLQEQNGWHEVKLDNGSVGWAPPDALVII